MRRLNRNNKLPQQGPGKLPVNWIPTRLKFIIDNRFSEQQLETSTAKAQRGAAVLRARSGDACTVMLSVFTAPSRQPRGRLGLKYRIALRSRKNETKKKNRCIFFLLACQLLGLKMKYTPLKWIHVSLLLGRGNGFSTCWFVLPRQACSQSSLLTPMRSSTFILQSYFGTNDTGRYKPTQAE